MNNCSSGRKTEFSAPPPVHFDSHLLLSFHKLPVLSFQPISWKVNFYFAAVNTILTPPLLATRSEMQASRTGLYHFCCRKQSKNGSVNKILACSTTCSLKLCQDDSTSMLFLLPCHAGRVDTQIEGAVRAYQPTLPACMLPLYVGQQDTRAVESWNMHLHPGRCS